MSRVLTIAIRNTTSVWKKVFLFDESGEYEPREIINAFRAVMWAAFTLFDAKLNSGIFNRPPATKKGSDLTPEQRVVMNNAIQFMYFGTDNNEKSPE